MSCKVKIGIIGCGGRINYVVRELLKGRDGLSINALCDINPQSLKTMRDDFHLGSECAGYSDYRDFLAKSDVQWVIIGSWNCYHLEHVLACLEAGKHVFCEKPMATTLKDCIKMAEAIKRPKFSFIIGFVLRYSQHYRRIKEMLSKGRIGKLTSFEFNETLQWCHGGFIHSDWRRLVSNSGGHLLEKMLS